VRTAIQVGFGVLKGSPWLQKNLLCVCLCVCVCVCVCTRAHAVWGIFFEFLYFPFFFCCFIIPFLQGPQIPSQCSVIFVKWRPIYTRYLKMCGPEIKHSPNSSKPQGVTFMEDCER
jgi:hypothetical protein